MNIIESFSAARSGRPSDNEDRICITEGFAAIVDGVTSGPRVKDLQTSGQRAADRVAATVQHLDSGVDAHVALRLMTEDLRSLGDPNAAASVVIFSKARRQVWAVGDCRYLAGTCAHAPRHAIDILLSQLRSLVIAAKMAQGASEAMLRMDDPGREAIEPWLHFQKTFANDSGNSRWGYGVVSSVPTPHRFLHIHQLTPVAQELILASDGFPVVFPTLEISEKALQRAIAEDPLCIGVLQGTKCVAPGADSFDDRSYLRLSI